MNSAIASFLRASAFAALILSFSGYLAASGVIESANAAMKQTDASENESNVDCALVIGEYYAMVYSDREQLLVHYGATAHFVDSDGETYSVFQLSTLSTEDRIGIASYWLDAEGYGWCISESSAGEMVVRTDSPDEDSMEGRIRDLETQIAELELRLSELESEQIPLDPNQPDWVFDYFVHSRDPQYQFVIVCTLEDQSIQGIGYRMTCVRPAGLQ